MQRWRRALTQFHKTEATVAALEGTADEDRFGDALDAFYRALRRLLRTPAPDLAALSLKIDLTVDHEIAELTGGDRCLAALKADARALARANLSCPCLRGTILGQSFDKARSHSNGPHARRAGRNSTSNPLISPATSAAPSGASP